MSINNAGVMACTKGVTVDGYETQFGTDGDIGVINRTSLLRINAFRFGLFQDRLPPSVRRVWVAPNLPTLTFCERMDKAMPEPEPGWLELASWQYQKLFFKKFVAEDARVQEALSRSRIPGAQVKSVEQGAATTVWAAIAKELAGRGGIYVEAGEATEDGPAFRPGYSAAAFRPNDEKGRRGT
ncbi:hypothetical protein AC579_5028 [Pseudocercospora musae]|uniref:Uncharacterized protein n=1 Tax=Pseudocercospora musae TaxID=113226 RepID=A0A139IAG9_9PEZI|nr:hypothetical protein AC579_5028 [Pseudocercospora musae]